VLRPEQIARYDTLSGYGAGEAPPVHDHRRPSG
jgi:hypothetical protein